MRAVARACATFALLALVAIGFSATCRICGPTDASAREAAPPEYRDPLVSAVLGSARPAATGAPSRGLPGLPIEGERRRVSDRAPEQPDRRDSDQDTGGEGLTLNQLSAWDAPGEAPCVYLSFMPIRNSALQGHVPYRKAIVEGEEVDVADVAPDLKEEHVRVELDGEAADVASLMWYYAGYGDLGGADIKYMPVCLVRVARPALSSGTHDVSVTIVDVDTGGTGVGLTTFTCDEGSGEL
jgi:hypothetical protein